MKSSKKTIDNFFGCRIVKAMKRKTDEFVVKTKKIDTKTLIIFGDSKNPDDWIFFTINSIFSFLPSHK